MATLVTGGTGFVGANILKDLASNGHQVISFDINGLDQLLRDFIGAGTGEASPQVTYIQGDIVDRTSVERLGNEHSIDKIVHAAVYTVNRVALETDRSRDVVAINIEGTANLLELARTQQVPRFVYVSSGAVYGSALPGDQTLNEDTPPAPQDLYGITKFASEMITRRYGELHGISTASVRLSTPYGPMERITGHRAVMVGVLRLDRTGGAGREHHRRGYGSRPGLYLRRGHRRRYSHRVGRTVVAPRPLQRHGRKMGDISGDIGPGARNVTRRRSCHTPSISG